MNKSILASVFALVMGMSFQASAADLTSSFQSSASVPSSCVLRNINNIDFNDYDAVFRHATVARQSSTIINVVCNGGTTANLQLDEGLNKMPGSTCAVPVRALVNGSGKKLLYTLGSSGGKEYGCDPTSSVSLTFTQFAVKGTSIRATIPPGQDAPLGSYSDTITVKVTF